MITELSALAVLATAPMSPAQDAPQSPPATAGQIASARAVADRLIAAAEAEGVFVNSTKDAVPRVTHVASGMTCLFDGGAEDRIIIFPQGGGRPPRGDDVGCISRDDELSVDLTLYATRYRPLPSEDAVLADAQRAITSRWPEAVPFTGGLPSLAVNDGVPPRMAAYKVQLNGAQMLTMALVSHRGEWGFKARATGPYEDALGVGLYAGIMLEGALTDRETP